MRHFRLCGFATCVLIAAGAFASDAADWPQWRGPNLNGSSPETGLPETFGPDSNMTWRAAMPGPGAGTPAVFGKRLFLTAVDKASGALLALCFDADSGAELWRRSCGQNRRYPRNNMASPSPVTDGRMVCFAFGTGRVQAFDLDGEPLWSHDLEKQYGINTFLFGYSSSPLLVEGRLIVQMLRNTRPDQYPNRFPEGASREPTPPYLLALSPETGAVLWKYRRPTEARKESQEAYTTPMPFRTAAGMGLLVYGGDCLSAHRLESGEEIWRWCGYNPGKIGHWRVVPSPVVYNGLAFVAAPKHEPLYAIRTAPQPRPEDTRVAWSFPDDTPDASTPLLYNNRLYVLQDDSRVIHCLDPETGSSRWRGDLGGSAVFRASLTGADGRIYAIDEKGEALVLGAGDSFEILHRVQLGGAPVHSSVVAANGCLYVRTADTLFCFDE